MSEHLVVASAAEARGPVWASASWLRAEILDTLAELNEQCLELICEQAAASAPRSGPGLLAELEALWGALDMASRRRAARCPFLLVDAGFGRAGCRPWRDARGTGAPIPRALGVRDRDWPAAPRAFFTVPRTVPVARLLLAYAWHLARSERVAAQLFLGMSARCADRVAGCTLRQVIQIAESEPQLLEPRWPDRHEVWRELLAAAIGTETAALERFRIRGFQLLAAETRRRGYDDLDM
ncbi:MAG: hypothetical protein ACRETB_13005 [Steroidobacteraceae bacterium]